MKRAFLVVAPFAAGLLLGCPSSTTSTLTYTPITGIQIDSQELVANVGCGAGTGQVYRYAAIVSFAPLEPDASADAAADGGPLAIFTSGVFDCFADAFFSNLPASEAGSSEYTIQIFAFDAASFPSALDCVPSPTGTGSLCPGDDTGTVIPFEPLANWTATCTAAQVEGVTVPAACSPLEPRGSGAGLDGGLEASPDATGDADLDGAPESG